MNKGEYKTFEKLKDELGDKFEEYMYKANIELLTKIDKAIEYINRKDICIDIRDNKLNFISTNELLEILKGE